MPYLDTDGLRRLWAKIKELKQDKLTLNDYSDEETVIGTWIDGKPLYRRVYKTKSASIDIDEDELLYLPMECIIHNLYGYMNQKNGNTTLLPTTVWGNKTDFSSMHYMSIWISKSNSINLCHYGSAYRDGEITLIIEYTKTTD